MKEKVSPYMELNRIEFMVTYQCSGKCRHCSVAPRLNQDSGSRHVRADRAVRAIETLSELFHITSVMTFGGEPLLYPDVVCAIHQKAAECGIGARQIITNGYFTKSPGRCREVVLALSQAGVNDLLLSVDAFHQETIPIEAVRRFAENALDAKIPGTKLHPAWVVCEAHDNPYNRATREVLAQLADLGIPVTDGNDIFLAGNAKKYLSQYYEEQKLRLTDRCGTLPYTAPLTEVSSLSIVPNGDVMVCGFTVGNIYTEDAADIAARYDPYSDEFMRAVAEGGVPALAERAKRAGITVDAAACPTACEVCRLIADQLGQTGK